MKEKEREFLEWLDGVVVSLDKKGSGYYDVWKNQELIMFFRPKDIAGPHFLCDGLSVYYDENVEFLRGKPRKIFKHMVKKHLNWEVNLKDIRFC